MVNSSYVTNGSLAYELDKDMEHRVDKGDLVYKYYKIGEEVLPKEKLFLAVKLNALCSGYCEMSKFIQKEVIEQREKECKEPEQDSLWADEYRYRKCILERSFDKEANKCKEYYEWMYTPHFEPL